VPAPQKPSLEEIQQQLESAFSRHKRGDLGFATTVYRQVLAQYPDQPTALHYLGLIAQQSGNSQQALQLLQRSIAIDSSDPRAHNHLGQVYVALNDKRNAALCFERALQIEPNHVASLNNLANLTLTRDLAQAIALYRRALQLSPDAAFASYNLAQALKEYNSFDEALLLYRRTIALDPKHFQARHMLGVLLEQRGEFPEAISEYLTVQRLNPRHVSSLANAIGIRNYIPEFTLVRRAEALVTRPDASDEDRIKLHRGLGRHYERASDFERAFAHFDAANGLLRRNRAPFDIRSVSKNFDRITSAFSRDFFARDLARISDSKRPVFIVGLPRSGTTLTEQILASHPRVFGTGELPDIPKMAKLLRPEYPECVALMEPDALADLANDYLRVIDRLAGPEPLRVTDKMPLNSLHLGLIARLFPEARVVYCRRDPLDIGVSCFVELFDLEHDYTTTLEDFGHYFLEHERLMAHWRAVLPIPIHEVCYEALIAEPETTCRAIIDYCGLDWHPACLDFHKTERTIQTPSRWQVRQPLYQTSIGRWRNYLQHTAPLAQLLEASGFTYTRDTPERQTTASCRPLKRHDRRWATPPRSLIRPIFIVAAPRSGSTLLFETLVQSDRVCSLGGEAHWLVENHRELRPGAPGIDSNRLTAAHAIGEYRDSIIHQIATHLVDQAGNSVEAESDRVFVEKTPKNALRIPFFDRIFPRSRFVFLWRDPRENISSILEAWRSGKFRTYKKVDGFEGTWSLLLPPDYRQCRARPLEEIAAFQWECTNRVILEDLEALDPGRWISLSYSDLIANPAASLKRILKFAELDIDSTLEQHLAHPLPHSRYTDTAPAADKWRMNEPEISRVLSSVENIWQRLRGLD